MHEAPADSKWQTEAPFEEFDLINETVKDRRYDCARNDSLAIDDSGDLEHAADAQHQHQHQRDRDHELDERKRGTRNAEC